MGADYWLSPFLHRRALEAYQDVKKAMRDTDNDPSPLPDELGLKRALGYALIVDDDEAESFIRAVREVRKEEEDGKR